MGKSDQAKKRYLLQGIAMIFIAVVTLEATTLIQNYFSKKAVTEEAIRRAEDQLKTNNQEIVAVLDRVETAVENNLWAARKVLNSPDSLWTVTRRIVENNGFIYGAAIAMEENYYPEKGRLYSPYSFRKGTRIDTAQLGTDAYNYIEKKWYTVPIETNAGSWSEPYFDTGGGESLMTTYSLPLTDDTGRVVGVLTSDISLDWLTELVGKVEVYPNAICMMISRTGKLMVCPEEELVMQHTAQEVAASLPDSTVVQGLVRSMLAGERGHSLITYRGNRQFVFYAPVERTGWSMAVVIPYNRIFANLRRLSKWVSLLQLLGLLLLIYILVYTTRSQARFQEVSQKKQRLDSELQIARDIQMSMLPTVFPTNPDNPDVDMAGCIVPAKQVGGDLYDFFISGDKLWFCIGDVSGKGVPASLLMAVTRSLFRTVSAHEKCPQRIVTSMNDSMTDMNQRDMFVTFFMGILDLKSGHLRYCNAGHNAPVVQHPGQPARMLDVIPNLPLGVLPGQHFQEQEADLISGEGLFLYTDGLTEAENVEKNLFGEERLLHTATLEAGSSASTQINTMAAAVQGFTAGCDPSDDLTMVVVRFTNPAPSSGAERHLILHNDISQIPQLAEFMEVISEETKMDQGLAMSLNLALEEAVTNVILYAYPEGSDGLVDVEAIIWRDHIDFIISDAGMPFDPTAAAPPDLTLDVMDRPIGGLGIYLVKTIMDQVAYERKDGKNILSMTKKL